MLKGKEEAQQKVSKLIEEKESAKRVAHINEVFLRNITRALPQYVFWKDINSVYLGCNKNYADLVGLNSPEEIIGKTDIDLLWQPTGDTAETFQKGDQDTIDGRPIINQEEILALPSGKTLITLVSKLPIIDNGQVLGIVGYFTNITELKNKERELIKAKREAEAANEAKSTFLTNISHDIRTPLTGMIGMTKILLDELNTPQGKEAANNLLKAENILLNLLNEVIEVTKLASDALPLYEVKFSIRELIDDLYALVSPSAYEKSLKLSLEYDNNIPNYVIGDQKRIHRILLNLVSNAIKFTSQGQVKIIVQLAEQQGRNLILKISIKDTGIGISKENQQIIFSRFTRLEPSYKGTHKGSGLGLSIVKQFISEIEGEIYVESEEGKGAIFTCIIPLKQALLDEPEHKTELKVNADSSYELKSIKLSHELTNQVNSEDEISSSKKQYNTESIAKILLVEDNALVQMVEKKLLEDLQCQVITADTGEIALELFKEEKFDLVFMDIGLPGKDGCETTKEMRILEKENNSSTPIIALTAHVDKDNEKQCLNAGMEAVCTKPINDDTAKSILNRYIHAYSSINEQLPVIDLDLCTSQASCDKDAAKNMLEMLVNSLPETENALKAAYDAKDLDKLQFTTHKLLGATCYCGVPRLKFTAQKLEEALKAKSTEEIEKIYKNLLTEIQHVLEEYKIVQ
ncbi:MAG: putative sensory histidine-kinase / response regulator [Burkholderiales bacterium]|nr:putative sensory histidine-kinase / response regulator [Burkholderiales bacterium]